MQVPEFARRIRMATPGPVWAVGEKMAASGRAAFAGPDESTGGYLFKVASPDGIRYDVWLWPKDLEWECDCEAPSDGCAHTVAALLALIAGAEQRGVEASVEEPSLVLALKREGRWLDLRPMLRRGSSVQPLTGARSAPWPKDLVLSAEVQHLLRLSRDWAGSRVPGRHNGQLVAALVSADEVTLDGKPIRGSKVPLDVVAVVDRVGTAFRVELRDPDTVEGVFEGDPTLLLSERTLRPRGYGKLTEIQRHQLRAPLLFHPHEIGKLTAEWIPALERAVKVIRQEGVPQGRVGGLETLLWLRRVGSQMELQASIVYGDPPVAEVRGEELLPVGGVGALPPRDRAREKALADRLDHELGMRPGQRLQLEGEAAARFVRDHLPKYSGTLVGDDVAEQFRLRDKPLEPVLRWTKRGLDVSFSDGHALVGADRALGAWQRGESVVALEGGGFAELPAEWMEQHAERVALLLEAGEHGERGKGKGKGKGQEDGGEAADGAVGAPGQVATHLAPLAAELLGSRGEPVPPDLMALVESLRGTRALPPREPPPGLCADLRPYQLDGWRWLRLLSDSGLGGVLADDMGLGKTLQALTLLLSLKAEAGGAALVVAPTSVLRNWESEAARFSPELRTAVLHGPRRDAGLQRLRGGEIDLAVTSYALLRRDVEDLQGVEFGTVILDEAQQIKNPDSQTAKAARSLHARRRFALTGTPIENHLSELWSQFEFLMPGFFGSRTRFEERLGIPAARGDEKALRALRDRVRPFVLRRMKEQVAKDLPPRTETILRCPLTDAQRAAYEAVRAAALKGLQVPGTKGESSGAGSVAGSVDGKQKAGSRRMAILAALLRLRQAACHAALVPGGSADDPSGKLDLLLETLTDLADEGHRALVFSQWTSLLDLVEPRLAAANLGFLRLDGSTRDRAGVVAQFQDKDGPPVFLVSLKAGGTGLNLVAADHVIHLDPWWNPAVEQQATDRAHRIGQDKPVFVWKLVSEGTVEERVLALQERKKAVAASVLADAAGIDDLGEEELLQLLESAAD